MMKKDIIKTVHTNVETIVDKETSEVLDVQVKKIQIVTNPDNFSFVYANFWNILLESPLNKADIELLAYLIKHYSDGSPFTINSYIKRDIASTTKKSLTTYNNSTRRLLKFNLIYKVDKRTYKINPRYAFKGYSNDRKKAIIEMTNFCRDC